mgnify:CR=1 FL=1
MKKDFIILLLFLQAFLLNGEEARLMRFPAISGDRIVFSYGGDLYTTAVNGGIAQRLTAHIGYEMFARFSPDGKTIAFTGQYDGNTEIYTIPSSGGTPQRLTYTATVEREEVSDRMGPNNITMGWTPDGKNIIYRSRSQSFNSFIGQLYLVSSGGGLSEQLPLSEAGFCSYSPDGTKLAFNRVFREFRTWKYYTGGMADDIWVMDIKSGKIENITSNPHQDIIPMWHENTVYFLSDRDRTMNLFSYNTQTRETHKLTNYTDYDIKFPSIGMGRIIYEQGGYLFTYTIKTGEIKKLTIEIISDRLYSRNEWKDASLRITQSDLSPHGERVLFSARGDVFTLPAVSGTTLNLTRSAAHDRNATWSPDGKTIAWVSDASGEDEIWIQKYDGTEPAQQLTKNSDTYKFFIRWSPDSKKIMWNDRKLRLQYIDIETRNVTLVNQSQYNIISYFDWSPDSKWITFSDESSNEMNIVYLYSVTDKQTYPATSSQFNSFEPTFSHDGKYLVFISDRDFEPTYSEVEWNYTYTNTARIYLLLLNKKTPSPFSYKNDQPGQTALIDDLLLNNNIDIEGLQERLIPLNIEPATYWNITATGKKIYYITSKQGEKGTRLMVYDLEKQKETQLDINAQYTLSTAGNKMLVSKNNCYYVIDAPSAALTLSGAVDVSSMKVFVDYPSEWRQIFTESWRQMRDFFYVENMHGVNWEAIRNKYEIFLPSLVHRDDLTYIIGEMIGELNAGHAYVNTGEKPSPEKINIGLLGARFSRHPSGYFKIDHILDGVPWDNRLRSPLRDQNTEVNENEYIIAINGIPVTTVTDIYQLLVNTAGKKTELRINSKPDATGSRSIIVIPVAGESELYYYNWVKNNMAKVEKATNGEVGYIHIPDMSTAGLNEFVRYFYPQLNKKALIIDDRGNGGGNVSPMIIERLRRELTRGKMARNTENPWSIPDKIVKGPVVVLINKYSASDGDLFAYAIRKHNIGTLIGTRTWGGVVGIAGSLPFVDGSALRKPEYASYAGDKSEWIIEGTGVEPDIFIDNDPFREFNGTDDQLNKAIEIIREQLKTGYRPLAPLPPAPDKSK